MADKHPHPANPGTKPPGKDGVKPHEPETDPQTRPRGGVAGDHPKEKADPKKDQGSEKGGPGDKGESKGNPEPGKKDSGKGDQKTDEKGNEKGVGKDDKTDDGGTEQKGDNAGDSKGKDDGSGGKKDKGDGGNTDDSGGTTSDPGNGKTGRQILENPPNGGFVIKVFYWSVPPDGTAENAVKTAKGVIHSDSFRSVKPESLTLAGLRKYVTSMSAYSRINKWCTEDGGNVDDESLSFPDYLDMVSGPTAKEPKQGSTPSINVFYKSTATFNTAKVEMPEAFKPDTSTTDSTHPTHLDTTDPAPMTRQSLIPPDVIQAGSDGAVKGAGDLSETEWDVVLRNCAVFYGWCVDQTKNQIQQAPKAAFRIKSTIASDPIVKVPLVTATTSSGDSDAQNTTSDTSTSVQPTPVPGVPKQHTGIPDFRVNDSSTIEVTACEYEFETSMARNDFSNQSTEASMSAGYAGFAVNYPRCDLFLYPPDLEPTDELKDAIAKIRKNKNIQDLRRLHLDFGHLFCQNLTIGGRLQSTKIIQTTGNRTVQDEKESFKYSIGVSVSTPVGVDTGMKHTEEHGSETQSSKTETSSHDRDIFEACGGDTILANNPVNWAPTVAKYQNWRVINRDGLTPLADAISGMDGYQDVKACFVQAVPAVSKFIEMDDSRQTMARFRLTSPLNSLSLEKIDPNAGYYLGHDASKGVTPRPLPVYSSIEDFWLRIDVTVTDTLFTPTTFKAPALLGYKSNMIGNGAFGSSYNDQFRQSEWTITAPFDNALTHGTRIVLQTSPDPASLLLTAAPATTTADGDKSHTNASTGAAAATTKAANLPPKPPVHMAVFRNQQGVFLPCMSDDDQPQYWRILKKDGGVIGQHIKEGDEVRLCWAFSDQLTGFRDFLGDIFGRRRAQCPDELKNQILYMKLPWPRFETLDPAQKDGSATPKDGDPSPSSMFMAPADSTNPIVVNMKTTQSMYKYVGQDVSFRIDLVTNQPYGDVFDYMLKDVVQLGSETNIKVIHKHPEYELFRQWIYHSNLFYF